MSSTSLPTLKEHGTEKVIEAIHQHAGVIKPLVVPVKLLATVITHAAGGSFGKEGPCAQIGAGISLSLASLFRLNETDRKKLLVCGVSAGFATVTLHRISDHGIRNGRNPAGGEDGCGVGEVDTVHAQAEAVRAFGVFAFYNARRRADSDRLARRTGE